MSSERFLRSASQQNLGEWLIGNYNKELRSITFPSNLQVLSFFLYNHYENKQTISQSLNLTTQRIRDIWESEVIIKDYHIKKKLNNSSMSGKN